MKIEALQWAAKHFRESARSWAMSAQPIYKALGLGTSSKLEQDVIVESEPPTVDELFQWVVEQSMHFEGKEMQVLAQEPGREEAISLTCHHVVFWVKAQKDQLFCGMHLQLASITILG